MFYIGFVNLLFEYDSQMFAKVSYRHHKSCIPLKCDFSGGGQLQRLTRCFACLTIRLDNKAACLILVFSNVNERVKPRCLDKLNALQCS